MKNLKCRSKDTKALIFSAYPIVINIIEQISSCVSPWHETKNWGGMIALKLLTQAQYLKNKRYTVARMNGTVSYAKR